jgi:hypothetical protein
VDDGESVNLRPGAFHVLPGGPPHGSSIRSVLEGDGSSAFAFPSRPSGSETTSSNRTARDEDTYLVEASLVLTAPVEKVGQIDSIMTPGRSSPPLLVTAQPLRRKRLLIGFGVGSLLMVAMAVWVTLAVLSRNRVTANAGPTPVPIASCPVSPLSPVAVDFRETLPNDTLAALENCSYPQSKALEWVTAG